MATSHDVALDRGGYAAHERSSERNSSSYVLVRFDRVYGLVKCYPANAQAETLARIAGTKTLKPETVTLARALGLTVRLAPGSFGTVEDFEAGRIA